MNYAERRAHAHVTARLKSRYGFEVNTENIWKRIRDGRAKQHMTPHPDRLLWDVPYRTPGSNRDDIVIQVVTDKALTMLITAVPSAPDNRRARKERNREFFKRFDVTDSDS